MKQKYQMVLSQYRVNELFLKGSRAKKKNWCSEKKMDEKDKYWTQRIHHLPTCQPLC